MHITVLGAGVTGLTTAWYLARDGHQVEVVERNQGVALEASFANGAQLSYSYVAPLAGPGVLPKVPPWLLRRDAPLRFYPALDLQQWRWLLEFVLACNRGTSDLTTRRLLALSFYSRALMHSLSARKTSISDTSETASWCCSPTGADFDGARRLLDFQRSLGCEQDALDRAQCIALEPLLGDPLSALGSRFVGGIHTVSEEVGDCYRFCQGLEIRLREMGVTFRFDTRVTRLETRGNRVTAIDTPAGSLPTDLCVMTLGAHSPDPGTAARHTPADLPTQGLQRYATAAAGYHGARHQHYRCDAQSGLSLALAGADGTSLRVAGMADIAGYSKRDRSSPRQAIVPRSRASVSRRDRLQRKGRMPCNRGRACARQHRRGRRYWARAPMANLYFNCGHGALGWTLALGSARILADLIKGAVPEVPLDGFTLRG